MLKVMVVLEYLLIKKEKEFCKKYSISIDIILLIIDSTVGGF